MPMSVPWAWQKSTIRLRGAMWESSQMPASSGEIYGVTYQRMYGRWKKEKGNVHDPPGRRLWLP